MIDWFLQETALPNLHPALVHFPIALLPLAVALDLVGLVSKRQRWLPPAATFLYVVTALGAWAAVWAGERAADSLVGVPAKVQPSIGEHSNWAHWTLYTTLAIAALRLVIHLRPETSHHRGARGVVILLGVVALGLVAKTADLGGALVYRHGLGVERPAETEDPDSATGDKTASHSSTEPEPTPGDAAQRLEEKADGTLVWRPAPGDLGALSTVLELAGGARESVRAAASSDEAESQGLTFEAEGSGLLLVPRTFGDVQVEAKIENTSFRGRLGLVHHYRGDETGGFFTVSTKGEALLADRRDGSETTLDETMTDGLASSFSITVSSAGRHLKGMVDGETVTHGHIAPDEPGRCGLVVDGEGAFRILEIRIVPLADS